MPAPPALMRRPGSRPSRARRRGRLSGGLSGGLALTGWGGGRAPQQRLLANPAIWLRFRFTPDDPNSPAAEDWSASSLPSATYGNWFQLSEGYKVPEQGRLEVSVGSDEAALQGYFDDLRLEHTGGLIVQEQHQYAYGSPLTGLNYVVGTKRYRHGYQGQYAEQDPETGYESFELRLYNSRIGRWTSYDPYGQFSSPYVGMGNNPVSGVDPDGGFIPGGNFIQRLAASIGIGSVSSNGFRFSAGLVAAGQGIGRAAGPVALQAGVGAGRTLTGAFMTYDGTSISGYRQFGKRYTKDNTWSAASGAIDAQNSMNTNMRDLGPVPDAKSGYRIDISPEISTAEEVLGTEGNNVLLRGTGIQYIPPGYTQWGSMRVRLQIINPSEGSLFRDNDSYYLHDSKKGYSHGCVEVDSGVFKWLMGLKTQGIKSVILTIKYTHHKGLPENQQTNGRRQYLPR